MEKGKGYAMIWKITLIVKKDYVVEKIFVKIIKMRNGICTTAALKRKVTSYFFQTLYNKMLNKINLF